MKKPSFYFYRGTVIFKGDNNKWITLDFEGEYDTIDKTKNAIDKRLGGYSGRKIPDRWLKDEKLKKQYYEHFNIKT